MRRLSVHLLAPSIAASALSLLPASSFAAPPSLPAGGEEDAGVEDEAGGDEMLTADGQPMPTGTEPAGPGEDVVSDDAGDELGAEADADADFDAGFDASADGELAASFDDGADADADAGADASGEISMGAMGAGSSDNGPGMVMGRREPTMNSLRGPIGLAYTSLADVGEKYSVRIRLHTDFFVKNNFFCCEGSEDGDRHARMRGAVNLGFTFTEWTEVYFAINSSSNRNTRDQGGREDPPTVFALGDMQFGVKGAYRFLNGGVGLGGQVGMGLIAGSERLRTSRVNFDIAMILSADLRYLTEKEIPLRFTGNVGWTLDNSIKLTDWGAIDDELSREVLRFSSGANQSRVNTKLAIDAPIRLGKDKQYGIDPFLEYNWDIATYKEEDFVELTEQYGASPLQRSQAWLTIGLRANVYSGLFLDAAVDVGTTSPSYEFGPPVPPYQVILGLGWSIDPKPRVKEVPVPVEDPNAVGDPVLEGRILGRVADLEGNAIAGAKVSFPGLASNVILTDAAGMFTSYRFPEGPVTISVELPDGSVVEQTADVRTGEDAQVDVLVDASAAAGEDPVFYGTFTKADGSAQLVSVAVDGMGIQESFSSDEAGQIALALPEGEYTLTISGEGLEPQTFSFTQTAEGHTMTQTLAAGGAAAGAEAVAPAAETPLVSGNKYRLRLKKSIRYNGNDLNEEKSAEVLDQLAAYMLGHPEYGKIEIRVHTDDRGNPNSRSQSRADAVVDYLTKKGVPASRLEAKGWGAKDPVAVNITSDGRRKNNRTEVKVRDYDESKAPAGE
ncbi:OmpA family protein [Pseudenhygromyxa sp. WMMC2535]|uniref:OmpA family protein n=1 Tax=Pseudenhygromyxa sp. WMMC2535 TaxID=2712867 RepID=UPI0015962A4F|nr:OmpA family protein [Pseudenhygromyxa sp. WMMC2535]NVB41721.1 OmpA family protein [Pseudenhygromyxa sp. WMMC2535]